MAMGANHSAHSRNIGNRVLGRSRRCQADHSSAILSWTCNSDTCVFANQKAIAGASHVFSSGWGISNRRGLPTRRTFDYMLFSFPRNINQSLTNSTRYHRSTPTNCGIWRGWNFIDWGYNKTSGRRHGNPSCNWVVDLECPSIWWFSIWWSK